jgi:hypothetical protein
MRYLSEKELKDLNYKKWLVYSKWNNMLQDSGILVTKRFIMFPITYKTWSEEYGLQYEGLFIKCKMVVNNKLLMVLEVIEDCPPFHLKGSIITQAQIHNYICVVTLTNKIFAHLKTQTHAGNNSQKKDDYPNKPARSKDGVRRQFMPKSAASHVPESREPLTFASWYRGLHDKHGVRAANTVRAPEREVSAAPDNKDRNH